MKETDQPQSMFTALHRGFSANSYYGCLLEQSTEEGQQFVQKQLQLWRPQPSKALMTSSKPNPVIPAQSREAASPTSHHD
ncbi:hypothetical protein AOLI_G00017090 [Acnodon oligacanthus]